MAQTDGSVLLDTRMDTSGIAKGIAQVEKMFGNTISAAKKVGAAIASAFAIKQIVSFAKECIDLGSDLDEVQNVVDVTFGKMSGVIDEFAKNAAVKFGMSELAAKQYTGTMGAMLKSMGFTTDAAADMSMQIAGLAGDMASFYNLSTDEAFAKIRSGISGETEPLKQLGVNMSEVNLEQFRMAQGMTTAYSKMSQQEKALLRYNYLLSVTSDAQGDFARTSNSWANQMKILSLQFQSLKADLGKGFINLFTPALKAINTLLQGLAKLASAFRAFTELITGKKAEGSGGAMPAVEVADTADAYEDAAAGAQNLADSTKDTAKATKQAKKENDKYLSGLDEIHKYQTTDTSTTTPSTSKGSGASTPASTAGTAIDFGSLAEGETVIDKTAEKMKALYDTIVKGVQPTIDALKRLWNEGLAQLGKFAWDNLLGFYNRFLVPVGKWVFGTGLPRFIDAINNGLMAVNWSSLTNALNGLWDALTPFAIHVGEGLLWFWENVLVPLQTWYISEVLPRFLTTMSILVKIADSILTGAQPAFDWFLDNILKPIAEWTGGVFLSVWDGINSLLNDFSQWCKENPAVIDNITTFVIAFFSALAGIAVIMKVWTMINTIGALVTKLGTIIGAMNPVIIVIAAAIAAGVLLWKNWDTIKAKAKEIWDRIAKTVIDNVRKFKEDAGKMVEKLKNFIRSAWNNIKTTAGTVWSAISEKVVGFVETIRSTVGSKITMLKNTLHTIWTTIKSTAVSAWDFLTVTIPTKAQELRNTVADWIKRLKDSLARKWDLIKEKATNVWNTVKSNTIDKVKAIWERVTKYAESIRSHFVEAFNGVKNGIKSPINTVIGFINKMISGVVSGINAVIDTLNKLSFTLPGWIPGLGNAHFGLNISRIENYPQIPQLAQGAVIPPRSPFLAQLGEQKHGTNIEAPLDTIRQAMQEAGGGNIHLTVNLDGRVVYDSVIRHGRKQQQMGGANPFALA